MEDLVFDWPDPAAYIDAAECRRRVEMAPEGKNGAGDSLVCPFSGTCAAFGMETALMNMIAAPELYEAVNEKYWNFI